MAAHPFCAVIKPRWADIDANQHLRASAYSEWAAQSRADWLESHGFNAKKFQESGVSIVILEESTRYFKEIFYGESITIDLQLAGVTQDGSRFRTRQAFARDGAICAVYEILGAWFDPKRRQIARPPAEILQLTDGLVRTQDYKEIVSR
jgi:acyl-CoA thioester hydrolase